MTLSYIWTAMVAFALITAIFTGRTELLTQAALQGAAGGVTLVISMAGALCLWMGLAKVMEKSGITGLLAKLLRPLLGRLFPRAAKDDIAMGHICGNFTANLLGLGNAATPMGISAVKRMKELSGTSAATDEMCRLIVINTASVQLIPSTVAAVRAAHGAAAPFDILPAVWVTSLLSVSVGLLGAMLFAGRPRHG